MFYIIDYWEKEEVKIEIAEYLGSKDTESTTRRCLFDLAKEGLKIHGEINETSNSRVRKMYRS